MVSFGKWRFGRWYEGSGQYTRIESGDRTYHFQVLQELRRTPDSLGAMRRMLTEGGLDNVFRLTDGEVLRLIANQLTAGNLCLFEIERMTLEELWDAVGATPIGKEFLDTIRESRRPEPAIRWGRPAYRSEFDSEKNQIVLHQHFLKDDGEELSDNEWKQAIAMELGNAVNDGKFRDMLNRQNPPGRDEFTAAVMKLEFETRLRVLKAYNDGEFCKPVGSPACIALYDQSVTTFANFLKEPQVQQHRNAYAWVWDRVSKSRYESKKR